MGRVHASACMQGSSPLSSSSASATSEAEAAQYKRLVDKYKRMAPYVAATKQQASSSSSGVKGLTHVNGLALHDDQGGSGSSSSDGSSSSRSSDGAGQGNGPSSSSSSAGSAEDEAQKRYDVRQAVKAEAFVASMWALSRLVRV